jgi:hypothetical protein
MEMIVVGGLCEMAASLGVSCETVANDLDMKTALKAIMRKRQVKIQQTERT